MHWKNIISKRNTLNHKYQRQKLIRVENEQTNDETQTKKI